MSLEGMRRDFAALARRAHLNGDGMAPIPRPVRAGRE
jgi:hypothetical protein